jgi:hypothetical protein
VLALFAVQPIATQSKSAARVAIKFFTRIERAS